MIDPAAVRLAAFVASSEDAIITETLDGTIDSWNRSAERMFGYSTAEAIGRSSATIVPPENRVRERELAVRLRTGEPSSRFESVGLTRDGRRIPISVAMSLLVAPDGDIIGIARIVRDT